MELPESVNSKQKGLIYCDIFSTEYNCGQLMTSGINACYGCDHYWKNRDKETWYVSPREEKMIPKGEGM